MKWRRAVAMGARIVIPLSLAEQHCLERRSRADRHHSTIGLARPAKPDVRKSLSWRKVKLAKDFKNFKLLAHSAGPRETPALRGTMTTSGEQTLNLGQFSKLDPSGSAGCYVRWPRFRWPRRPNGPRARRGQFTTMTRLNKMPTGVGWYRKRKLMPNSESTKALSQIRNTAIRPTMTKRATAALTLNLPRL